MKTENISASILLEAENSKMQIKEISDKNEAEVKEIEKVYWEKKDKISKKISELQSEKNSLTYALEDKIKEIKEKKEHKFSELRKPIQTLEKIFSLIRVSNNPLKDLTLEAKNRYYGEDKFVESIETIVDNKYLKLQAFIYENRKPKNKYSLCIAGNSIFPRDKVVNYPYDYGCDLSFSNYYTSILVQLKDASTKEELTAWWNRNKSRPFWNITEHEETVELYKWVLDNCNTVEWRIAYLKHEKEYYENRVSRGTESEEYKEITKELKKLTKELATA